MHASFQPEVPSDQAESIELNFLRITVKPDDLATLSTVLERMGWVKSDHHIHVALSTAANQSLPSITKAQTPSAQLVHPSPEASVHQERPASCCEPASAAAQSVASQASSTPPPFPPALTKRFCILAKMYVDNMRRSAKKRGSVKDMHNALTLFLRALGDKPVGLVTPDDITHFADVLTFWPKGGVNKPCYAGKSIDEIVQYVKRYKVGRLMLSTQGKHMFYLDAFFNWLVQCKELSENPMRYISMARYQEDKAKKPAFTKKDLKVLFEPSRISKLEKPLEYWGPLVALYTGMRCNEIAQLLVDNIQTVEVLDEDDNVQNVPCIEVSDEEEGQSVKSSHSRRMLPIHSKLIDAGFLAYVEEIRKFGAKELFPGVSWTGTGPGHVLSAWFNGEYLRKECGIEKKRATLHCFRHTLNTMADRSRVPKGVMVTINGHGDGNSVAEKHYVNRADVLECQVYLEKLPFPDLGLPTYPTGRFEPYLKRLKAKLESLARRIRDGIPLPKKRGPKPVEDLYANELWGKALASAGTGTLAR